MIDFFMIDFPFIIVDLEFKLGVAFTAAVTH